MSFHVKREVITAGKLPRTKMALERFGAGVFPVMPRQLVRPRELPAAAVPRALVGLLARVRPLVGLQMRALGVDFVTGREVAAVNLPPLEAVVVLAADRGRGRGQVMMRLTGRDKMLTSIVGRHQGQRSDQLRS